MHKLTIEHIEKYYDYLMCSYGNTNNLCILSYKEYTPETFYIGQKRKDEKLIFFNDISYKDWVMGMIDDICHNVPTQMSINELKNTIYDNVELLLNYNNSDLNIANQEFVDIIRRVATYTIYGNSIIDIDFASNFNGLAARIMPFVITNIKKRNMKIDELLKYSIISGLSGLDLKGAPAAASSYLNNGIPMAKYNSMNPEIAAKDFIIELDKIYETSFIGIFECSKFVDFLNQKKELVWMTDDYIESYFDLLLIDKILNEYNINITIIPKNGYNGNDLCYTHLVNILNLDFFASLNSFINQGRLKIMASGPKMGSANVKKFSQEVIDCIELADVVLMKGCRVHEMLQGGLNKDTFSSFIVVRKLSEITSGFEAEKNAILFFHLSPNEYSFFGVNYNDAVPVTLHDKKIKYTSFSTIRDHFERKRNKSLEEDLNEFVRLREKALTYSGNHVPLYQEMNMLANKFEMYTKSLYNKTYLTYECLKRENMNKIDSILWDFLFTQIRDCLHKNLNQISLLDIGSGTGDALEFLTSLGVNAHGVDNSEGFINLLRKKEKEGKIQSNSFTKASMCDLPFKDESYDVVRMNASLLHLPIIAKGFSADLAISEAKRVLRPNGLIFISVKKGDGLKIIDTNEKLGKRIYQLYTHELLDEILLRNGFTTIKSIDQFEERNGSKINWIVHIAKK